MKRAFAIILILALAFGVAACAPKEYAGGSESSGSGSSASGPEPAPVVYEPNVMDIDFDALIASEKNAELREARYHAQMREAARAAAAKCKPYLHFQLLAFV